MKLKITRGGLYHFVIMLLLIMAGMNLLNQSYYLFLAACVIAMVVNKRIFGDIDAICLMLIGISWVLFSPMGHDSITNIVKPMLYVCAYFAGMCYLSYTCKDKDSRETEKFLIRMTVLLSVGPFVHYLLNMFNNQDYSSRNTIDFWTNQAMAATNQAAMNCMAVAIAVGALFANVGKQYKWMAWLVLSTAVLYNLILAGRTTFAIIAIVVFLSAAYLYINSGGTKKSKIVLGVALVILGLLICYTYDIFGIKTAVEGSNFYYRFFGGEAYRSSEDETRLARKIYFLRNFTDGILGGAHLRNSGVGYAHDIVFDTFDEAGIVAFFGMCVFLVRCGLSFLRFMKHKSVYLASKQIVLSLYAALFLQFMVEPILQAAPWLFSLFCFQSGMLSTFFRLQPGNETERKL